MKIVINEVQFNYLKFLTNRYACLVVEASNDTPEVEKDIVGVVDATVYRHNDVLQYLPGATEYIYISGIAVLNKFRSKIQFLSIKWIYPFFDTVQNTLCLHKSFVHVHYLQLLKMC